MSFGSFAVKIVESRIQSEIKKLIDEKLTTAFLASVLPVCSEGNGTLAAAVKLTVSIASVTVDFTVHAGTDTDASTVIPAEVRTIDVITRIPVKKPDDMAGSAALVLEETELAIRTRLSGIEFTKSLMGAGATVHAVALDAVVKGSGKAVWC